MTTSDAAGAVGVIPGVSAVGAPGVDDATLDRIANDLLGAIPGAVNPKSASSAALIAARIRGPQQIPPPASVAAAAGQTAIPEAAAGGAPLPSGSAPIDWSAPLPAYVAIHDGSIPRLFDDSLLSGKPPGADTPSYYYLTPILAPRPDAVAPAFHRRLFDVNDIRRDFPILEERVHGKRLVWLDNAATTQKPQAVIDRLVHYYSHEYSNVHRAAHELAARSTDAYESAREKVQRFLGAGSAEEIVFVRGTTEAVNLVAGSYVRKFIGKGDEIVLSTLEHHSNIVPWQFVAEQVGAVIRVVPVTGRGEVLLSDFERTLSTRTRFVALTHVSNALGTILPVREMIAMAHRRDARVLIDGAQAVSHFPVNVQELDADFYALSGHKLFGPSAIGVLYGKKALLDEMPPWQGGGNMIQRVTFEHSTFADPPARFEAGTAALGPAVGLGAAVDYLDRIGMENVAAHERELLAYATEALSRIPGVRLIGTAPDKAGVVSFVTDKIPAEEMGKLLDQEGIAVRAGHHCAQPTMDRFGLDATVRPSLALYNTHDEIDQLERAVRRALQK
jgi:cysteine desulfurase/selenocysteine lyase